MIDGEDGVRARIVVKDIASGGGKAKSLGISSPTPSAESIKMALGIGGYSNAYGWTLDCSAAFMHTPLGKERKVIVRFPASMSWPDNSPLFMDLSKSLNGIRSASLDWLEYVQGIVKPLGLTCDVTSNRLILEAAEWLDVDQVAWNETSLEGSNGWLAEEPSPDLDHHFPNSTKRENSPHR